MTSVSCLSAISSVGLTPQATAAALRASVSVFEDLVYRDFGGANVIGAMVAAIPREVRGKTRLESLAALAVETTPDSPIEGLPWSRLPLIVCLPERERPGPRLPDILAELPLPNGDLLRLSNAAFVEAGSASAFAAIHKARERLNDPRVRACLVLAVDSLIDARVLAWLDRSYRLKTSDHTDGVIPGEAACLAIVSREPMGPAGLGVLGLGFARETATILDDRPFVGKGLASALRGALRDAGIEMHEVDFRISDVAGESYAFEELVLAQARVMRRVRPSQPLWHPADCIGDCGAAAGLIQMAWAEQAFARGYAPGPIAALHGSSTYGARAVAIVGPSRRRSQDEP